MNGGYPLLLILGKWHADWFAAVWVITAVLIASCRFFWGDSAVTGCPYVQVSAVT